MLCSDLYVNIDLKIEMMIGAVPSVEACFSVAKREVVITMIKLVYCIVYTYCVYT